MFLCQQTIPTSGSVQLTQRSMHSVGLSQRAQLQLVALIGKSSLRAAYQNRNAFPGAGK